MVSRRSPDIIALDLLECVECKRKATKWDLIKVLGTTWQFDQWIENFLKKEKFIEERKDGRHFFYKKTKNGDFFHRVLKNGLIVKILTTRMSGKRLRDAF